MWTLEKKASIVASLVARLMLESLATGDVVARVYKAAQNALTFKCIAKGCSQSGRRAMKFERVF